MEEKLLPLLSQTRAVNDAGTRQKWLISILPAYARGQVLW